jgi:RNA polymerase sigma-70 factor (ECF subfamily)
MSELDDIQLARTGDREACSRLFHRHWRTVYLWLRGRVASHEEAEDLTQQTFLRAYPRLRQLREASRFLPWLRRVAQTVGSRRRSRAYTLERELRVGPENPADLAVRRETRQVVQRALAKLPHRERSLLLLAHAEELPLAQVARLLELPVTTLRRRLAAALRNFRHALEREGETDGL